VPLNAVIEQGDFNNPIDASFDPASLLILEKLNEVLTNLNTLSCTPPFALVAKSITLTTPPQVHSIEFNPTLSTDSLDELTSQDQLFPAAEEQVRRE
jgi:hypothetical protein